MAVIYFLFAALPLVVRHVFLIFTTRVIIFICYLSRADSVHFWLRNGCSWKTLNVLRQKMSPHRNLVVKYRFPNFTTRVTGIIDCPHCCDVPCVGSHSWWHCSWRVHTCRHCSTSKPALRYYILPSGAPTNTTGIFFLLIGPWELWLNFSISHF